MTNENLKFQSHEDGSGVREELSQNESMIAAGPSESDIRLAMKSGGGVVFHLGSSRELTVVITKFQQHGDDPEAYIFEGSGKYLQDPKMSRVGRMVKGTYNIRQHGGTVMPI